MAIILSWNFALGQQSMEKVLLNPEEIKTLIEQGKLREARAQILKMPRDFLEVKIFGEAQNNRNTLSRSTLLELDGNHLLLSLLLIVSIITTSHHI